MERYTYSQNSSLHSKDPQVYPQDPSVHDNISFGGQKIQAFMPT